MRICKFKDEDIEEMVSLFYDTVHTINSADYSQAQLDAWAPEEEKHTKAQIWKDSFLQHITYVAKADDRIVGFSDLTDSGYLDRLFVHKDYQRKGIASALLAMLESEAGSLNLSEIYTDASITAKPFFELRGYIAAAEQTVVRAGVKLTNFQMVKQILPS